MKWSFKVATIAGTEVRIHVTFFILLVFVALEGMRGGHGLAGAFDAVLFISAMFFCVLLHEFGHVFAARGYGIHTPDITLLPIGGMARLERMPRKPSHELVVAICGPLVNVAIAAGIGLALGFNAGLDPAYRFDQPGHFWEKLMAWNILMVAFNLIPAFPMDGGRVLRAFMALFLDYGRATRWAATVGQAIALMAVFSMMITGTFQPLLLLIAVFIFMAAGQEATMVGQQEATRNMRVADAMLTDFRALEPGASLRDGVDLLLAGTQQDFPVLDEDGHMLGMITRNRLIAALAEHGASYPARDVMEDCPEPVSPRLALSEALQQLQTTQCPALPVTDSVTGRLIGLLTAENIGETLMVRAALKQVRGG